MYDSCQNASTSGMKSSLTTLHDRSERELQPREVRPRAVGPPLPAAGGRADRGLLRRDVGRHVEALLEGERRLDLLRFSQSVF